MLSASLQLSQTTMAEQAAALPIPIQMPSRNGNHIKSLLRFSQL